MGYLSIDHRGGQGLDEKSGTLLELDTVNCAHCQTLVAILKRPKETVYLSNLDIAKASGHAPHLSHEYKGKHTCRKCKKTICRVCAQRNVCDPIVKQLERFFSQRG